MAAFNQVQKLKILLLWFFRKRKRRANKVLKKKSLLRSYVYSAKKLRIAFLKSILVSVNRPSNRALWMYPRSLNWFEMVDQEYDEELSYSNFRVTRGIFEFLLNGVMEYIRCKDTVMRSAISAKRRLAITLYFLASTAEYRTIANLFGVSRSFVCAHFQFPFPTYFQLVVVDWYDHSLTLYFRERIMVYCKYMAAQRLNCIFTYRELIFRFHA